MMKKIIAFLIALILTFSLCACGNDNDTNPAGNSTKPAKVQKETQKVTEASKDDAVLSPESAVQIYLNNLSTWQVIPDEFFMGSYYYLFLDLDFDGVLELVTSRNEGTGRFSTNNYYKINLTNYSVEQIDYKVQPDKNRSDCDYNLNDYPVLLKDRTTGDKKYIMADYTRAGGGMYALSEQELFIESGKIVAQSIFMYDIIEAEVSGTGEAIEYYYTYTDGSKNEVSKSDYDFLYNEYYSRYKDLDLDFEFVSGYEFDEANEKEKTLMLLDVYEEFSYDGFDFDDIKTYDADIEIPTTKAPETLPAVNSEKIYVLADYKGMTINDVADIWGQDYVVSDEWFSGSWKGVYYEDGRTSLTFFFNDASLSGVCTGSEPLVGIIYSTYDGKDYYTYSDISVNLVYDSLVKAVPDGESYELLINDTSNFSFTRGETRIIYSWNGTASGAADSVTVQFS